MLQRAASNAYTWWWASHIRTKQSKWLNNDLQEMEERVKAMIKLIDEDADSFAKKAEMYFRRRPELIGSVEEAYRAYKALADRFDRISGELHKANHTIATAFPDQVPMIDDDDDDDSPFKAMPTIDPAAPPDASKLPKPPPELPRLVSRNKRIETQHVAPPKPQHRRGGGSHVTPEQAQQEIDRLQRSILVLQTEKEFCKSSYHSGLTKYWDIERQMTEMQGEISQLQDEFNVGSVIEDDDAQALMAATTLKSCEDSLVGLQEKQKKSTEEARLESERIEAAKCKLEALKGEEAGANSDTATSPATETEEAESTLKHERFELQSICDKVKDLIVMSSESNVAELVEKIEQLVEKVISLEIIVSSQTAQIMTLRAETDELHKHLREVEDDKKNSSVDPSSLNQRLTQVEEQLQRILNLERNVKNETGVVRGHFAEACDSLNDLSEKLQSPNQIIEQSRDQTTKIKEETKEEDPSEKAPRESEDESPNCRLDHEDEDITEWEQSMLNGLEGRDKVLMYEYTSILRNYKDTRKKLAEIEKRNEEYHSEVTQQIQELRCENAIKDEEIKNLRRKLFSAESIRRCSMKKAADSSQEAEEAALDPGDEEEVKICHVDVGQLSAASPLEDKFRADIDTVLDENLDFWLRFSTSYHQIQKFSSSFKELQAEAEKVTASKDADGGDGGDAEEQATNKKLREFNTELQVWLEHNEVLQRELQSRFASLCSIQEEITRVTKSDEGADDALFTPYQAAKFQGEVINMQGENNKVAKELQTGLDHVKGLQAEVGKALSRLHDKFEPSTAAKAQQNQYGMFRHLSTKSRVPLKTFLFAASKPKKTSIFACMNPVYHHRHHVEMRQQSKVAKVPH